MKKIFLAASLTACLSLSVPAYSLDLGQPLKAGEEKYAIGAQSGFTSYGISMKYRHTDIVTVQGTLGLFGDVQNYGVRGLYTFKDEGLYSLYGFGGLGLWTWDSGVSSIDDETVIGFNAGAGVEYEVVPKILVSAELGLGVVNFDNYGGFSSLGLGLGAHYRF